MSCNTQPTTVTAAAQWSHRSNTVLNWVRHITHHRPLTSGNDGTPRAPPVPRLQSHRTSAPLRTTDCSDGPTRLQPRRISHASLLRPRRIPPPLRTTDCSDGPTGLQPHRISEQLRTTSCPGRTQSAAAPPDRSAQLHRPTAQAPKCPWPATNALSRASSVATPLDYAACLFWLPVLSHCH
jgi:hypothetical protein